MALSAPFSGFTKTEPTSFLSAPFSGVTKAIPTSSLSTPFDGIASAIPIETTRSVSGKLQTFATDVEASPSDVSSEIQFFTETEASSTTISAKINLKTAELAEADDAVEFSDDAVAFKVVIATAEDTIQFNDAVAVNPPEFGSEEGLIIRGAELHSVTLEGNQGGEIELSRKIFILNTSVVGPIAFVSTNSNDVGQTYRIEGISDFNLTLVDEVTLNGLNMVETLQDFAYVERITKIDGNGLNGDVIISAGGVEIGSLEPSASGLPETTEIVNILADVPSNPEIEKVIFEKFFLYNASPEVVNFTLKEQSDPDQCVTFALDPTINDDTFATSRDLRPFEIPFDQFTSLPKTGTLSPNENIGVWLRIKLEAGRLVTSKRYQMKLIEESIAVTGSDPNVLSDRERIITLIGRHAGGLGLAQPLSIRASHPLVGGGNPLRFIELGGAKIVEELAFEPDPVTFRDQFYYNTRINQLFRKIQSDPDPVWKSAR